MKAMILAAGLGTRLRPLTDDRPKALVDVGGKTLLEITLTRLHSFGIREVIVNVHHFADMVTDFLKANNNFGMRVEISREEALLDTGGGLKKAAYFFLEGSELADKPFILHNVDVISTIDLDRMVQAHRECKALATLAVQERKSSRQLLFDDREHLCGRKAGIEDSQIVRSSRTMTALAFAGIHVISPQIFSLMAEEGAFSIIDSYLRLAAQRENILGFRADEYYWRDLGRIESIAAAEKDLENKELS